MTGTTVYSSINSDLPRYAVRRDDGLFLGSNGEFVHMINKFGNPNTIVDYRVYANYWAEKGIVLDASCQVVVITIATVITAAPIDW